MKTYKRMTLNDTIEGLRALPDGAEVVGFHGVVDSYRGYYERNAVEPDPNARTLATQLAGELENEIGTSITGYKGGDYQVDGDQPLYYAGYGDTGPAILGFEREPGEDAYEPVLLAEDWRF